jgi:hypothetical protein
MAGAGLDSLRPSAGLDVGRRSACRADVLLPSDVKWLPGPIGVGDAVAMSFNDRRSPTMVRLF